MKKVVCENAQGRNLTISYSFPFFLLSIDGIYSVQHTVTTSKGYDQDGESITGSTADKRNIVITVQVKGDFVKNRNALYDFFQPKETGTLYYYEGDVKRKIEYEVESITNPETGAVRNSAISLICPNPLFSDIDETRVSLSAWQGGIKFALAIHNPFTVTTKINTLMQDIFNSSNTVLGLRIRFKASGEVVNPSLIDVNRHTTLIINTTMHSGDVIEVTTGKNEKRVSLTRQGVKTNIINLTAYPPQWPQLYRGDNLFRYNADEGIDALSVDVFYTQTYWGC